MNTLELEFKQLCYCGGKVAYFTAKGNRTVFLLAEQLGIGHIFRNHNASLALVKNRQQTFLAMTVWWCCMVEIVDSYFSLIIAIENQQTNC